MAVFTVKFDTGNAAFEGADLAPEIARVLRNIAERVERDGPSGFFETVRDTNGNDIGRFALKNDDGSNYTE